MGKRVGARQNWESLRVFAACARHMSFTRAAAELGLTQAAVSQRIKHLEARLETRLFTRTPQLALTRAGAGLLPSVEHAFNTIDRAIASVSERQTLVVTTTLTMSTAWLLPRLAQFRRKYPSFVVVLDVTDDVRSLDDERFDIAVRTGEGQWPGTRSHRLFPIDLTPMFSPKLLEGHESLTPERLGSLPLLPDEAWAAWFRAAGVRPPRSRRAAGIVVNSQQLAAEAAMAGQAVALLSPRFFGRHVAEGWLVQPFREVVTAGEYHVAWHADRGDEPAIAAFRNWIVSAARMTSGAGASR